MATAAPSIITKNSFTLTDRLRIQQDSIRRGDYRKIGKLTSVLREGQISTVGFSQEKSSIGGIDVFGVWKKKAWCKLTLDWLNQQNAPILAVSRDGNDLLLPFRMNPLPDIPDPRWNGFCISAVPAPDCTKPKVPRIPQLLAGCPVVGDRVTATIRDRITGKLYAIFHPLKQLQLLCGRGKDSGFGRISFMTDPATGLQGALMIHVEPDSDGKMDAYFVGGTFYPG